jgi:7-carboxy-7-deazaguanine synthase
LKNSGPDDRLPAAWREKHDALRWQPEVVKAWLASYGFQLKFVVAQVADVDEIEGMLAQLGGGIPRSKVLLMPEGTTVEALRAKAGWLGELCKVRGYRYAPRLHIELYGNKRGT